MTDPVPATDASSSPEKPRRPIRDLVEGFGIALLMAIFFKYFAIEAYQIPTSSMQPTMMGSSTAGVYDRLIVDKTRFLFRDPQMWDIAVFKYPIRENQNYVKRVVGMGGTKVRICGGNVYQVTSGDGSNPEDLTVQRKPADLQEHIWKQIFPARRLVLGGKVIDNFFDTSRGEWTEDDGVLRCRPGRSKRPKLKFDIPGGRGVVNEVWDGYPTDIAKQIQKAEATPLAGEQVQDARFGFTLTPQKTPDEVEVAIEVDRENQPNLSFAFRWSKGQGKLVVVVDGKDIGVAAEPFDCDIPGGEATSLRLAHYDDLLTIEVDGELKSSLECSGFKSLTPPTLVTPFVTVSGGEELRYENLTVDRDLHYLPSSRPGNSAWLTKIIEIPEGHYMMLGDNTLQSVDSRDWTSIEIGVLDGKIVNPRKHPDAPRMVGNLRPTELSEKPDPDENPVAISSLGKIVFTDRAGEVHTLEGQVNLDANSTGGVWGGRDGAWFQDEDGEAWHPETALVQFVPREHIIGRPLFNFWPAGILGPFRLGLIR